MPPHKLQGVRPDKKQAVVPPDWLASMSSGIGGDAALSDSAFRDHRKLDGLLRGLPRRRSTEHRKRPFGGDDDPQELTSVSTPPSFMALDHGRQEDLDIEGSHPLEPAWDAAGAQVLTAGLHAQELAEGAEVKALETQLAEAEATLQEEMLQMEQQSYEIDCELAAVDRSPGPEVAAADGQLDALIASLRGSVPRESEDRSTDTLQKLALQEAACQARLSGVEVEIASEKLTQDQLRFSAREMEAEAVEEVQKRAAKDVKALEASAEERYSATMQRLRQVEALDAQRLQRQTNEAETQLAALEARLDSLEAERHQDDASRLHAEDELAAVRAEHDSEMKEVDLAMSSSRRASEAQVEEAKAMLRGLEAEEESSKTAAQERAVASEQAAYRDLEEFHDAEVTAYSAAKRRHTAAEEWGSWEEAELQRQLDVSKQESEACREEITECQVRSEAEVSALRTEAAVELAAMRQSVMARTAALDEESAAESLRSRQNSARITEAEERIQRAKEEALAEEIRHERHELEAASLQTELEIEERVCQQQISCFEEGLELHIQEMHGHLDRILEDAEDRTADAATRLANAHARVRAAEEASQTANQRRAEVIGFLQKDRDDKVRAALARAEAAEQALMDNIDCVQASERRTSQYFQSMLAKRPRSARAERVPILLKDEPVSEDGRTS